MWPIDDWDPLQVGDVAAVLAGAPFRWWISGGHALELHVGRSWRSHGDMDVGVVRSDVSLVRGLLREWTLAVATGGKLTLWDGGSLRPGENNLWAGRSAWSIDFTISDGDEAQWIYRRDRTIHRPWASAVLMTDTGLPYIAPDIQLLFKSKHPRPKDYEDARMVIPRLSGDGRAFLRRHLPEGHEWRRFCQDW